MAIEYLKPTTSAGGTWANPTYAYDGTDTSDNSTYASETTGDSSVTWSGIAATSLTSITDITLYVVHEFTGNATNDVYTLEYSLDGGNNWETPIMSGVPSATTKTAWNTSLSTSQDTSLIQVRAFLDKVGGGDSGIEARVWDIRAEVTGTAEVIEWGTADINVPIETMTTTASVDWAGDADISSLSAMAITGALLLAGASSISPTAPTLEVFDTIEYDMSDIQSDAVIEWGTVDIDVPLVTVSTDASVDWAGDASPSSTSAMSVDASVDWAGDSSLTSSSSVSVDGIADRGLDASLTTTAEITTADGTLDRGLDSSLTTTTDLAVDAIADRGIDASITTTSTLAVDRVMDLGGSASLTTTAALDITGTLQGVQWGDASLSSLSALSVDGSVDWKGQSSLTSTSGVATDGSIDREGQASISSTSGLAVDSSIDRNADSSLTTTAAIATDGIMDWAGSASITTTTDISITGTLVEGGGTTHYGQASFSSASLLEVFDTIEYDMGTILSRTYGQASISSASELYVHDSIIYGMSDVRDEKLGDAEITSTSALSADGFTDTVLKFGTASLHSYSSLTINSVVKYSGKIEINATSHLLHYEHAQITLESGGTITDYNWGSTFGGWNPQGTMTVASNGATIT